MEEGNWIAVTEIPLIAAEGTGADGEAAGDAECGGPEVRRGAAHEAEGLAIQVAEATHNDRAERTTPAAESPINDAEHAVVAEDAPPEARNPPPEATVTLAEDAVRAPAEEVNETAHGPTEGDADDAANTNELEAALLAVNSPAREAHPTDAGAAETDPPSTTAAEAEV
jgi:hypothetical protein